MASNTTNLDLVKQANNENWSNDIHNQNLEKIDEFAGVVNGKINTTNAQDMTNLNNVVNTGNYSYDKLSSAMTNAPSTGTYFSGTLVVKYYQANKVMQTFVSSDGKIFTRHLWNGTWGSWQQMALQSQLGEIKYDEQYTDSATTMTFNLETGSAYLVCVNKLNTSDANLASGLYLVQAHASNSTVRTVIASSAISSITVNRLTLTVVVNTTYCGVSLVRIGKF